MGSIAAAMFAVKKNANIHSTTVDQRLCFFRNFLGGSRGIFWIPRARALAFFAFYLVQNLIEGRSGPEQEGGAAGQ